MADEQLYTQDLGTKAKVYEDNYNKDLNEVIKQMKALSDVNLLFLYN